MATRPIFITNNHKEIVQSNKKLVFSPTDLYFRNKYNEQLSVIIPSFISR